MRKKKTQEMKRARGFKPVATKPRRSILSNRLTDDDDDETWPSQHSQSLTTAVVKRMNPQSQSQPQPKADSIPILEIPPDEMTILPYTFFQIDALDLAPRLLGKFLRRDDVVLQITEVISLVFFFNTKKHDRNAKHNIYRFCVSSFFR